MLKEGPLLRKWLRGQTQGKADLLSKLVYYIEDEDKAVKEYRALEKTLREQGFNDEADKVHAIWNDEWKHFDTLVDIRSKIWKTT